jgi:hypothetical protein
VALFRGVVERSRRPAYFSVGLAEEIGHKSADFPRGWQNTFPRISPAVS